MSVLNELASASGERGDVANQVLAKKLAESGNQTDLNEITQGLFQKNKDIQSDCIKVLYEVGYLKPELVAPYVQEFLRMVKSKNNRLVWGTMIALSTVAALKAEEIYKSIETVIEAMNQGSVITVDNAVSVLAAVSAAKPGHEARIAPVLLNHLRTCRPKEVAQHSERSLVAINSGNKSDFRAVLEKRLVDLIPSQLARVKKVLKTIEALK